MGSLLDKSLVRRPTQGGVTEFVLLESLRQYAAELLAADGDAGATRDRHAAHFTEAAVAMEAAIGLPAESDWWSGASASEEANFLSAWEHSLAEGHLGRALHLAAALGWHSFFRGHLGTGRARLDRTLQAPRKRHRPTTPSPRRPSPQGCWRGPSATRRGARPPASAAS